MRRFIMVIGMLLIAGCSVHDYAHTAWKGTKFITPPVKSDQDRMVAQEECIKKIDEMAVNDGWTELAKGIGPYHMKRVSQYEGCMIEKGYDCVDDCANSYKSR